MGPPSYMGSVVDRNVVMRRMTVFRDVHAELGTGITTRPHGPTYLTAVSIQQSATFTPPKN
jgi:hypothetical protein